MLRNQTRSNLLGLVTLLGFGLVVSLPTTAFAQTTYYTTTGSTGAWNTARWSTSSSGPFTSNYSTAPVSFTSGSYSFAGMGATVNVGNVTVLSNVNVAFPTIGSTYATNGTVQTVDVAAGGVYDLSTNSVSTAAGTGFLKTGAGVFATAGGAYTGGFTLNAGTVILRGANAMGSGGALALNGGAVAGSATRDLTGKYTGGITIGGNVQFGEFSSNVAPANDTANLTFSNNMALGSANRTLTLGNKGTMTFGGVIANTTGGITFAAVSGAEASVSSAGRFDVTNTANTFTGDVTITGPEVRFAADGSLGAGANNIIIDGGRFGTVSGSTVTLSSTRSIQVGSAAGTSISVAGATGTMTYNGVISDKNGSTGAWAKQGAGVLILGGTSNYSGNTTISNGTIQLTAGNNRLPTSTVLSLGQAASANVGTFNLGGVNQTVAGLASVVGTNAAASVTNLVTTSTGTSTLTLNVASGTYTYGDGTAANSGGITGSVGITKEGAGTQILGGSNSYSRPTTLSAGTLRSGTGTVGNFAFGSGTLALNGGTLTSGTDNAARTFANNVTVGGDVAFGDATATGGLAFSGTVDLGNATRTLTTVQTSTFSGPISNGGLIKSGSALLTLSSSNTYSAGTTVSAGTLTAGNVNAFGSGSMTLSASSTLDLNSLAIANTITNNGGTLANAASYTGTQSLTAAASFGALGGTLSVINGGSASLTGAVTGTVSIAAGGSAVLGNGGSLSQASLSNAGTFIVNKSVDSSLSTAISGSGAFQKLGSGILTVTGSSTSTGATTVSTGTLKAGNSSAFGTGTMTLSAGATLDLNSLSVANNITHNGGTLANAASYTGTQSLTAAASFGDLGGTLSVINGGSASLTGAVTGTMSIAAGGSAVLGNGGSLSQASLSNAGTFIVNKSVDSSLSTAISGAGGFQKLGSGILTVTGNNTFTGATTVSAGGLKVNGVLGSGSLSVAASAWLMGTGTINGPVTISGTLTPGASPGVITLASLVLTPTSSTVIEIASAGTRGTAYDGVSILDAGGLTYGGTMSIVFGGSAIANDTTFDVFSFTGSSTGSLAAVESSGYYAGTWTSLGSGTYQLVKDAQTITFSQTTGDVIVVPEPTAIALAAVGLGAMAYAVRRRYRQA
jgi:autotransporter-associated beta strand protein